MSPVTRFLPGATQIILDAGDEFNFDTILGSPDIFSTEAFLYVEDEVKLAADLTANVGLHGSALAVEGANYASLPTKARCQQTPTQWCGTQSFLCSHDPSL